MLKACRLRYSWGPGCLFTKQGEQEVLAMLDWLQYEFAAIQAAAFKE